MLTELRISNFALIEQVSLQFSPGFHVLTGETGAGKSILVDALAVLVGGRASVDHIRTDAPEAVLEAAFVLPTPSPLLDAFREDGIMGASDVELIVRRMICRSGRHRLSLNGALAPLHSVQRLAGTLVDIHGQHEQQSLLASKAQLDALDAFGRLMDLRNELATQHDRWQAQARALSEHERAMAERREREDLLRFQYQELHEADVAVGEDESLQAERQRLAHAQRLTDLAREAYRLLYGDDGAVLSTLGAVGERLKALASIDPEAAAWTSLRDAAVIPLQELVHHLRRYQGTLDEDPDRLFQIEERLDRLQRLKKKYHATLEGLRTRTDELRGQLDELSTAESRVAELQDMVRQERTHLEALADRLSDARQRAAERMQTRINKELMALRMEQTRLQIDVSALPAPGPTGRDRVEFLLSANPGEPLMPLAKVASGGELSRIMLALKTVLAETDTVPVLVFDEIDTGIGGAVAAVMGQRLRSLSKYHQVLCITHLPQLASHATAHMLVAKTVEKKRTVTRVTPLDAAGRREELARMLGGLTITRAVRQTASEMLHEADQE